MMSFWSFSMSFTRERFVMYTSLSNDDCFSISLMLSIVWMIYFSLTRSYLDYYLKSSSFRFNWSHHLLTKDSILSSSSKSFFGATTASGPLGADAVVVVSIYSVVAVGSLTLISFLGRVGPKGDGATSFLTSSFCSWAALAASTKPPAKPFAAVFGYSVVAVLKGLFNPPANIGIFTAYFSSVLAAPIKLKAPLEGAVEFNKLLNGAVTDLLAAGNPVNSWAGATASSFLGSGCFYDKSPSPYTPGAGAPKG